MAWREQTEGSSGSSARSPASPPYMRWARSLHELLEVTYLSSIRQDFIADVQVLQIYFWEND